MEHCARCRYVVRIQNVPGPDRFRCQRYPPQVIASGDVVWPRVAAEDTCGEFTSTTVRRLTNPAGTEPVPV